MKKIAHQIEKFSEYAVRATSILIFSIIVLIVGLSILSRVSLMGFSAMVVLSGNMIPEMQPGDMVVAHHTPSWQIGTRDIISVKDHEDPLHSSPHRIMASRFENGIEYFYTQDNASGTVDKQKVSQDEILGTMLFRVPRIGFIIDAVKKPEGFLLFVMIPAVYLVLSECIHIYEVLKHSQDPYYDPHVPVAA